MESRRDYRKLMNIKKRNKNYAKATILGAMGLGFIGITTQVNAEEWKANSVEQIKEAVKEAKDGVYIIKTGDTLSGISEATGITIETLAKVNNIENIDLIYAGDKLVIKTDGGTVALVDENNNVKNEVPLTKEDKEGIKEVQKQDNNNVYTSNTGSSTKGNNGIVNTMKPTNPSTGGSNNHGNNGGTTNPIKPVNPVKPIDPVNPIEKEYVITIKHISEDGEVLSKETRKAKEGTTVEAKALDFSDRGYEVVGEPTQTIKATQDSTIMFTYKKIDDTKPVENTVNIEIKHLGDDGKILSKETIKAEKDSIVKVDAKDFTEEGYVLDDELTKSVKATEGATITFNYRKVDTPLPVEKSVVTTQYVAEDGTKLADNKVQEVEKGTLVKETAIQIDGYKVIGDTTQLVVANSNKTITFTYAKDEKTYEPKHTESEETRVYDEAGIYLGATVPSGYTEVSRTQGKDEVTTQANGDTHTIHVTNVTAKKDYVPVHTTSEETKVITTTGEYLGTVVPSGYTVVSTVKDNGTVTTAPNGDTNTHYVTTITVEKDAPVNPTNPYAGTPMTNSGLNMEYNGGKGMGNSGMVWADQRTASMWALTEIGFNEGSYLTWQVQLKDGTVMWTSHIN